MMPHKKASTFYSRPVYGRAFKPFSTDMVEVTSENVDQWRFKKLINWRRREYVIFVNDKREEIMQSLQAIKFIRLRPGEENFSAKLTNEQGLEIFRRANEGESRETLAAEFGVTEGTVSAIKNIRTRVGITLNYLNGVTKEEPAKVIVAKRNKGKKLSAGLAKFIRSDKVVQRMSVKDLAKKYAVSERTIQRILKGQMYPETK